MIALDLLGNPCARSLSWAYFLNELCWFGCNLWLNSTPDFSTGVHDGKIIRMSMTFEEEMSSWALPPEEVNRAVTKYAQLYELFNVLQCDEMAGYSDSHYCDGMVFEEDPDHMQKIFRFARTGRQILIIPMEEGRARRVGEETWQLIVDL
ncbi:MAG TPA: hypothetical protein VN673_18340 [Clostridia bacterium]|nr:hypothetical protein [Clostridia bacterium]